MELATVEKKLVVVPDVRERVPRVDRPFTLSAPKFAVLAFDVVEVAVLKYPVPLAVMLVVDAPPDIVKSPLVMVEEALERKPFVNVARPVCVSVPVCVVLPETVSEPSVASCEKRFVDDAVVEKRFVVVAFPREMLPLDVKLAVVSVVPSNVRFAESVKAPAVVMYGTLPDVRDEAVRLVVLAVAKYPVPETESAVELAKGAVNFVPS